MVVPDYESLMRPTLLTLADGSERTTRELYDLVASSVGVTDEDRQLLLPSGRQTTFNNRVAWVTYMAKAGLIRRPRRGVAAIIKGGKQLLSEHAGAINGRLLEQFPEFIEFKTTRHNKSATDTADTLSAAAGVGSPTEAIHALVEDANAAVAAEVLERILEQSPAFLERLVLKLLEAMGYGGVEALSQHLGGPGDSLTGARADRGIFITTSTFTSEARAYVDRIGYRIVLIDGERLAAEMVRRNMGVDVREVHEVKRIDEDFFTE